MKILGIETSLYAGSVAVSEGNMILGEYYFNTGPSHSEKLLSSIEWLLSELDIDKSELSGISVSLGPGSFTSLRIGVAAAKGLCYSLDIPITGISTLELMANNLPFSGSQICPVIDAKRGEVYCAFFKSDGGKVRRITQDMVISAEKLARDIKERTVFVGEGALLYSDFLDHIMDGEGFSAYSPEPFNYPRAGVLSVLGASLLEAGQSQDPYTLSPNYIRKSEAEAAKEKG